MPSSTCFPYSSLTPESLSIAAVTPQTAAVIATVGPAIVAKVVAAVPAAVESPATLPPALASPPPAPATTPPTLPPIAAPPFAIAPPADAIPVPTLETPELTALPNLLAILPPPLKKSKALLAINLIVAISSCMPKADIAKPKVPTAVTSVFAPVTILEKAFAKNPLFSSIVGANIFKAVTAAIVTPASFFSFLLDSSVLSWA